MRVPVRQLRIIPARAGFTVEISRTESTERDHPRTRGVYRGRSEFRGFHEGSSPHARGLRAVRPLRPLQGGIIPARAGFTGSNPATPTVKRDHPRTRGVYLTWSTLGASSAGSSPHARGLHRPGRHRRLHRRIIPARAGFTRSRRRSGRVTGDHPRTRGVYWLTMVATTPAAGSSPHARGLHLYSPFSYPIPRIIPARAGFTDVDAGRGGAFPDHPRTRGVYSVRLDVETSQRGSSPHARGLQSWRRRSGFLPGIIPARAGFTGGGDTTSFQSGDHPRTRGVYILSPSSSVECLGSSPHARGLRSARQAGTEDERIIPARAGFTASSS